jgi:homoserine O-acetyltransferase
MRASSSNLTRSQVVLQCGITLPRAKLAYKTYGKLAVSRDNVVLMPTF